MINDKYNTFLLLAQNKSFTEAAKKLFCSQPTVTQHIKQLEQEFTCQLINRRNKQIELTQQGEILIQYINQMQELESEMRNTLNQSLQEKNIVLYISQYIANNFFHELFEANYMLCKPAPYEVNSYCYAELKQCLFDRKTKFAIMPIYDADQSIRNNFDIDILFEEEFFLVMPKDHPLASRQTIYARDLKQLTILLSQSFYLNQHIKKVIDQKNVTVDYMQMANFELILKAVQHDLGLSFLPNKILETNVEGLIFKKVKGLTIKRKNGIVYNRNQPLSVEEKAFCQHIIKSLTLKSS